MSYIIRRAWQRLKWNKWISILMIIEMMLGMSVLVYAMNMYSSLVKEERRRANQSRDLCLEISGFNEKMLSETVALTENIEWENLFLYCLTRILRSK